MQALSTHRKVPETGQLFTGAQKLVLDGIVKTQALSTHRKVPETGQLFTGAQKLVLDGIVKTLNELLLKSDNNGFNGEETPINVLQLFPDIKPTSGNGF
ncbi:unnamed protein product, partial [Mesorhabditis belari]|uniref:Uncharacterized protein n=1 Tax=Mesorhabditis belari TaxID=2138241 RepID=A0AAF3F6L7_9BILA